jgi:hypothetical protein
VSCLARYFPPDFAPLATVANLLYIITAYHACYPFVIPTSERDFRLDESALLRVVVLLSAKTRAKGRLNQDTTGWAFDEKHGSPQ